ncbi:MULTISPECIES: hypothetical protein [Candidatus Nitrosocaldus]|jgi:hypothetical protein|uniref:Uncharacterized protein n=1 Tax=Candidatus Nitrosocaldus cavascurensis TaxID=2058097 RepID=A0A2K5AR33_9ARCH|nr:MULTISPECIES: hypothetical protein [Candidatus Nitrosocaldus]SPC34108.1 protein of unknown function [Candidatus Nitrosocaldus cavascurensis]
MGRVARTHIILVITSVLLILYVFESIEVDSKNKEIADLNDRVKDMNSSLVEQIKMINKLVDERISHTLFNGSETRQYMFDGSYIAIDNQGYDYSDIYPVDIFTDKDGNIIIVSATDKIVKFDTNGREIFSIGIGRDIDIFYPFSFGYYYNSDNIVTVDSNGNIYVLILNYNLLTIFSKDGELMKTWTKPVHAKNCYEDYYNEDYFPLINNMIAAYSNGDVVVVGNNEIKRFSSDGKFIATYVDPCNSEIDIIADIAIDEDDNLYVLGGHDKVDRVYKLDEDGRIVTSWIIYDSLYPDNYPEEIRAHRGYVYVLDVKGIIHVFTDSGLLVNRIDDHVVSSTIDFIIDFAVSDDAIYIIENSSNGIRTIKVHRSNGNGLDYVWNVYKYKHIESEAHDIAVSKHNIFIALYSNDEIKIHKYNKDDGVKVGEWTAVASEEYGLEELGKSGIAYGDGKVALFLKDKVKVYDEDGHMLEEYFLGSTLGSYVMDVEIDDEGYIYVVLNDGIAIMKDGTILKRLWITTKCTIYGYVIPHYKRNPDGRWSLEIEWEEPVPAGTNCSDPDSSGPLKRGDIQFYSIGNSALADEQLYVIDEYNRRIQVFNKHDGRFVGKLNFINPMTPNHSIDAIVDMDVDDRGYIYIATTTSVIVMDVDDDGGDDAIDGSGKLVAAWGRICYPADQQACSYPLSLLYKDPYKPISGMDVDKDDGDIYILYSSKVVLRFRQPI